MATAKPVINTVVFDLGRVLIRIVDDWREAFARADVAIEPIHEDPALHDAVRNLFQQHERGDIPNDALFEQWATQAQLTPAQTQAILEACLCEPYADSMTLIDELACAHVPMACLSNTNAHHWEAMTASVGPHALGLDRLAHRFASHLARVAKPDQAIYHHVQKQLGADPQSLLFFDDLPANVDAAQACGWHAHVIEHDGDPASQMRRHLRQYNLL